VSGAAAAAAPPAQSAASPTSSGTWYRLNSAGSCFGTGFSQAAWSGSPATTSASRAGRPRMRFASAMLIRMRTGAMPWSTGWPGSSGGTHP